MKKLIVLTVMLCMTLISNVILAACSVTSSNTAECTMTSTEYYAHSTFYASAYSDITFQWHLTNGNENVFGTWVWVETPLGYMQDVEKYIYGQRYFGTMLTTDVTGGFEVWLESHNGGSAEVYAAW